ncbi:MAG: alcohol dehydrogenase catalytic domain-containing protein [Clostridiaceae bacterium]|nr:alcohol dehydrogenase catalytic domain-containing protein [Clostridiaceae bacterium]
MRKIILKAPYKMEITDCPIPQPAGDEVRIHVCRIGVCGSDSTIYRGLHPYVTYPVVLGHEISGIIDAVGKNISKKRIGERVTIIPHLICGICKACKAGVYNFCEQLRCTGAEADGAHCDYFCISSEMAVRIPKNMSLDDAALVEPACVAYHGAKRGHIGANDRVLIVGAGPIGVFCMQSCFALGAKEVYIADMDDSRLDIAKKLGATEVIHVAKETLAAALCRFCGSEKEIDVFYDCVGEKGLVLNNILEIARRGSRIVVIGVIQKEYNIPRLPDFIQHELALSGTTMYVPQDYDDMIRFISEGTITTEGMISHRFPLDQVPYVLDMIDQKKEKTFKILIEVNEE